MKVIVLLFCVVASTSAGNAVAWPGAIRLAPAQLKTIVQPQIQGFGYSTSEFINSIPYTPLGYQPHLSYQIPLPNYQHYQPVVSGSYYRPNGFLYPSLIPAAPSVPISPISPIGAINPIAPIPIQPPVQSPVSSPEPAGDEDTAVIEAADSSSNQQQPSQQQFPSNFPQTSLDSKNMPQYSQIPPQIPSQQFPFYPQFPQFIQPGLNFPPQQSGLQPNPSPSQDSTSISSFPAADNTDKNIGDEDTIAVDSA